MATNLAVPLALILLVSCFTVYCLDDKGISNGLIQPRVSVESSNMPAAWQRDAVDALETAFELSNTAAGRMQLFAELLEEKQPSYIWIAVYDYRHLFYIADYHARLRTNYGAIVFVFSATKE